jgi:hypothetical protein
MSKNDGPWSFEPMEIDSDPEPTWPIYDPNMARIVAVFYTEDEAKDYLKWRNKKQAKLKARKDAQRQETLTQWHSGAWAAWKP